MGTWRVPGRIRGCWRGFAGFQPFPVASSRLNAWCTRLQFKWKLTGIALFQWARRSGVTLKADSAESKGTSLLLFARLKAWLRAPSFVIPSGYPLPPSSSTQEGSGCCFSIPLPSGLPQLRILEAAVAVVLLQGERPSSRVATRASSQSMSTKMVISTRSPFCLSHILKKRPSPESVNSVLRGEVSRNRVSFWLFEGCHADA